MAKQLLLVTGTARSGTSALVNLLNTHSDFLIGMERYFHIYQRGGMQPGHFSKKRFLDLRADDTHAKGGFGGVGPKKLEESYEAASIIGDKYPLLYRYYKKILPTFPNAKFVYIIRNPLSVAESYQKRADDPGQAWSADYRTAVQEWNIGIRIMLDLPPEERKRFFITEYESLYFDMAEVQRLYDFCGVKLTHPERIESIFDKASKLNQTMVPRRDDIRLYVAQNADWEGYAKLTETYIGAE